MDRKRQDEVEENRRKKVGAWKQEGRNQTRKGGKRAPPRIPDTGKGRKMDGKPMGAKKDEKGTQSKRRTSGIQEDSIGRGETIAGDWETFTQREARIREECEKEGVTFNPEDDWSMPEREWQRMQDEKKQQQHFGKQDTQNLPSPENQRPA